MPTKITAKDFFLHMGAIVTFYASAIALITLLFEVINYAYPRITDAYQYYSPSISFQVATLIVAFPLFLFLSWTLQKAYATEPTLKDAPVRKWLAYITLFIAGAVAAGDLITLIYMFLDGQELTAGFLLKVLALFVVAGGIFFYYLREIRNVIAPRERNVWRIIAIVFILGSIIAGFMVVGSPADQRAYRHDNQRVADLQNIQWQIVNYYQQKGGLPDKLEDLEDPISGFMVPNDPETGAPYEYTLIGQSAKAFELCATFSRESRAVGNPHGSRMMPSMPYDSIAVKTPDNWQYPLGRHCFTRTIDPQLYPPIKR